MIRRVAVLASTLALSAGSMALAWDGGAPPPVESPDRPADQSLLTFPEWFLVFSSAEYARHIAHAPPSAFPFGEHVRQLWSSYASVARATRDQPFNAGYHVMIVVIATSTTVEYGIKAAWEALVGRVTEALRVGPTAEDRFAAEFASDYVAFVELSPWYEFGFADRLARLAALPPTGGAGALRGLERRYALATELAAKSIYGALIQSGTHASYVPSAPRTRIRVRPASVVLDGCEGAEVVSRTTDESVIDAPRQQPFTACALALAGRGASFQSIAGNTGTTAVSVLVDRPFTPTFATVLFRQPLPTEAPRTRLLLTLPVGSIAEELREIHAAGARVEHVFDF